MTATNPDPRPRVSDEDREPTWDLDQSALEQVLHDLDRVRTAFIQDYVDRRIENRHGDVTAVQIDKFRHNGAVVWDANYLSLAQMLRYRSSLVSHGWGPKPAVSPTKLGEFIDAANAGGMAVPWRGLQDYLRECGIEVSD